MNRDSDVPGAGDDLEGLIDAMLEGRLPDEGVRDLERLLRESAAARQTYYRYVHLCCGIAPHVQSADEDGLRLDAEDEEFLPAAPGRRMSETEAMVLPAMTADPDPELLPAPSFAPPIDAGRAARQRRRVAIAAAAAVLIAAFVLFGLLRDRGTSSPAVVASLVSTLDAVWDGPPPSTRLAAGELRLRSGLACLRFVSGAEVIVEGAAAFALEADGNLRLRNGKLAATVPPRAVGFTVHLPGGSVVDRGTEFGASVSAGRASQVQVYTGRVDLYAAGGKAPTLALSQGEAVAVDPRGTMAATAFAPDLVVRDIAAIRKTLVTHSTGRNLGVGAVDPHWRAGAVGGEMGPVRVMEPFERTVPNDPQRSQWVQGLVSPPNAAAPPVCFRTVLTVPDDVDPATVTLDLWMSIDNTLQLRINGRETPVEFKLDDGKIWYDQTHHRVVSGVFRQGENEIDFLVRCEDRDTQDNPVRVKVDLAASAARRPVMAVPTGGSR